MNSAATKVRLLIVDDHTLFRESVARLLDAEEDFEVVAQASDGRQVLDVLQQLQPDILLLDLKMPGLDGLATLQRLQVAFVGGKRGAQRSQRDAHQGQSVAKGRQWLAEDGTGACAACQLCQ